MAYHTGKVYRKDNKFFLAVGPRGESPTKVWAFRDPEDPQKLEELALAFSRRGICDECPREGALQEAKKIFNEILPNRVLLEVPGLPDDAVII